eukprot:31038-Pelagococcus_subviridis.AAC.15
MPRSCKSSDTVFAASIIPSSVSGVKNLGSVGSLFSWRRTKTFGGPVPELVAGASSPATRIVLSPPATRKMLSPPAPFPPGPECRLTLNLERAPLLGDDLG